MYVICIYIYISTHNQRKQQNRNTIAYNQCVYYGTMLGNPDNLIVQMRRGVPGVVTELFVVDVAFHDHE